MNDPPAPRPSIYAGLFLITLATLMYEILLTRLFSVTMWYHFSFVAISVSMFGMTAGALIVYFFPRLFTIERAPRHLAGASLAFAIALVFCFLSLLSIPVLMEKTTVGRVAVWFHSMLLIYVITSIPLVFSGIAVCLALTKFPKQVGRLYAADLAGAALGCIALVYLLKITDGPTAIFFIGCLAACGAAVFATGRSMRRLRAFAICCVLLLGLVAAGNTKLANRQQSLLRMIWVKGHLDGIPLYEKWNSFSRVAVYGDPDALERPAGWGLSPAYDRERRVRRLYLDIDAYASTLLPHFNGDFSEVEFLKHDMVNLAHFIRPQSDVLVIGAGGGSDILSALAFDQKSVTGVEINESIVRAANEVFGDFTGHLARDPRVHFVNDKARSYLARQKGRYHIIQASLIDSFAATAAGAFTLTENSLYTVEAWRMFLDRLTERGLVTFSRVYTAHSPGEIYRLVALASTALRGIGVQEPEKHIVLTRLLAPGMNWGTGTILAGRAPFSDQDLDMLERVCTELRFDIVCSPRGAENGELAQLASGRDIGAVSRAMRLDLEAPTDNKPFFFHMLRFADVFSPKVWLQGPSRVHLTALVILTGLAVIVIVLTGACFILPLLLKTERRALAGAGPLLLFFAAIGLGFMLVEISQIQRLAIFLGHPVYGLSVALFALLLSAGLGSYAVQRVAAADRAQKCLVVLLAVIALFGLVTPHVIALFHAATTPVRILLSVIILGSIGFFMGMPFPLGMKLASHRSEQLTPWFWGVNGATSVCASVLAVIISITLGITAAFFAGFACYALAWLAYRRAARRAVAA